MDEFDPLYKKLAFIEPYRREKMFEDGLEEFEDSRLVPLVIPITSVLFAYKCCAVGLQRSCSKSGGGVPGV